MQNKNTMELKLPGLSVNEGFARSVVGAFATQLNPTLEEISDIKTAVSEAVTNAIVHAYPKGTGELRIFASLEDRVVRIIVQDYGVGIKDIAQARQPFFSTAGDDSRSGMGFTVMETFMDSVYIDSEPGKGTTVELVKTINLQD